MAVSRAVAPLNVLTEYTLGFIKIGGKLVYIHKIVLFEFLLVLY